MSRTRIPSERYDRQYFASEACPGFEIYLANGLPHLELHEAVLKLAGLREDDAVLDFGAGRGEFTLACAARARQSIGIDYARAALEYASRGKRAIGAPVAQCAHFIRSAAGPLPLRSSSLDVIFMLDVIEHLDAEEVATTLREFHRVLRPGGRLVVHTPNRWDYDIAWPYWGYFVSAGVRLFTGRRPAIGRNKRIPAELEFHINEQSPPQLRDSLRAAGFARVRVFPRTLLGSSRRSLRGLYVMVAQYLRPLSLLPPLSQIFNHSLLAVAVKARSDLRETRRD